MIPREPTVAMTQRDKKREFRRRMNEMLTRKSRYIVMKHLMETTDKGLRRVREGAATQGLLGFSQFTEEFRQRKIELTNERMKN